MLTNKAPHVAPHANTCRPQRSNRLHGVCRRVTCRRRVSQVGDHTFASRPLLAKSASRLPCSSTAQSSGVKKVALDISLPQRSLAPPSALPLYGRRVLITAPRQYATRLASYLAEAGARPFLVPAIAINETSDTTALDAALQRLNSYTHLAFTSRNGIAAVLARLEALYGLKGGQSAVAQSGIRICALGNDRSALLDAGYPCHVLPEEASTQGLVRHLAALGEAAGANVLCPVPRLVGLTEPPVVPRFLAALRAAGATATRVDAYDTAYGCESSVCSVECKLLLDGDIDAVVFSSTAEAEGLLKACGGVKPFMEAVTTHGIVLAAHGPYTAAGAARLIGLPVPCVSKQFGSFAGVVAALEEHFAI